MNEVFIVAWTGGYEAPSYKAHADAKAAAATARAWWEDADPERDSVDVLCLDLTTMQIERVERLEELDED